jgi:hypothetical protein
MEPLGSSTAEAEEDERAGEAVEQNDGLRVRTLAACLPTCPPTCPSLHAQRINALTSGIPTCDGRASTTTMPTAFMTSAGRRAMRSFLPACLMTARSRSTKLARRKKAAFFKAEAERVRVSLARSCWMLRCIEAKQIHLRTSLRATRS